MKKLAYFIIPVFLTACSTKPKGFDLPNQIKAEKTSAHIQIPATQLFVVVPKKYTYEPKLNLYSRGDSSKIMFVEVNGRNFIELKGKMLDTLHKTVKDDDIYLEQQFKMGPYDALLVQVPDPDEKYRQLIFFMGNTKWTAMVMGKLIKNNDPIRDEAVAFITSLVRDEKAIIDYSMFQNFSLNTEGYDFKHLHYISQISYYTASTDANMLNDPFLDQVMVMQLPAMSTDDKKAYALRMLDRYKESGIDIKNIAYTNEVEINGNNGIEIEFNGSFQNRDNRVYQLVIGNENTTVLYSGIAYQDFDENVSQYKAMAKTLEVK